MGRIVAILIATAIFASFPTGIPTAWGQGEAGVSAANQGYIRNVIESQINAFLRDDGIEAFSYAAPAIQRRFQTPETFMEMVQTSFTPVYRPREVEVLDLKSRNGQVVQEVLLVGPDGRPVLALYTMEQQADGRWRIAGVVLVNLPQETT